MPNKPSLFWLLRAQEDEKRMQRIANGAAKEIGQMYRRQYLKIVKELESLKAQIDAGKELTRTQLWNYSRWRHLEKQLQEFVNEATRLNTEKTTKVLEEVFEKSIGTKAERFEQTRLTMPVTSHQVIGSTWSGERYSTRIWKNQAAIAERLKYSMEDMLVQGRGLPDIKKAIMEEFRVAFNDADRLVRTEAAYVLNKANVEKYKAEGVKKVVWDTGLEDGNECAICKARSDKVYLINEAPIIPAHPRCRCIYSAVVEIGNENVPVTGPGAEMMIQELKRDKNLKAQMMDAIIGTEETIVTSRKFSGRHNGKYKNAMEWKPASVRKAVLNYEKTAKLHLEKIDNPEQYDTGWLEKDKRSREGLIQKWMKDAVRNYELSQVMRGLAAERGIDLQ